MELFVEYRTVQKRLFDFPKTLQSTLPKKKIGFILRHKDDPRFLLPGIGIVDFPSWGVEYLLPFSPENAQKISDFLQKHLHIEEERAFDAHTITDLHDGTLLISFQMGTHFLRYDYSKKTCQCIIPESLGFPKRYSTEFAPTGRVLSNGVYEYLASREDGITGGRTHGLYVTDFRSPTSFQNAFEWKILSSGLPHMFTHLPGHSEKIVFSDSCDAVYHLRSNGEPIEKKYRLSGIKQVIYRKIFQDFTRSRGEVFSDEAFIASGSISPKGYEPSTDFLTYTNGILKRNDCLTLWEYGRKIGLHFVSSNGEISIRDRISGEVMRYETSASNAANFIVSADAKRLFVSNHNFLYLQYGTVEYLGPATIDHFDIETGGKLTRRATFHPDSGYRFTSHAVFYTQEYGEVLVVSGGPCRIFFVCTETMEELFHFDVYPNQLNELLGDFEKISRYLQREGRSPDITVRWIEKIDESGTIFLVSRNEAFVFSFWERRILSRWNVSDREHPILSEYHANSAHCDAI